jgi:hypothetical protein
MLPSVFELIKGNFGDNLQIELSDRESGQCFLAFLN